MKVTVFLLFFCWRFASSNAQTSLCTIGNPDKEIIATCDPVGTTSKIGYQKETISGDSKLGLISDDEDFSRDLSVIKVSSPVTVKDICSTLSL